MRPSEPLILPNPQTNIQSHLFIQLEIHTIARSLASLPISSYLSLSLLCAFADLRARMHMVSALYSMCKSKGPKTFMLSLCILHTPTYIFLNQVISKQIFIGVDYCSKCLLYSRHTHIEREYRTCIFNTLNTNFI